MKKNIPTFEFMIDESEESGIKAISIVTDPAFQSSFITFSKPKPNFIQFKDKKKRICAGLSLIPNVPVFRVDEQFGEYYGFFSAETIEKIVEKYHEEMVSNKVNLNHCEDCFIDAFMVEDFIVNSEARVQDLKKMGIEHENIMGAWFTAFKIKDEVTFEAIEKSQEAGNPTGFSVEAYLDKILVQMRTNNYNDKIEIKMKKDRKSLLNKIVALFSTDNFERVLVPELGVEIEWTEVGAPVNVVTVDAEGAETLAPVGPGEFVTDAGTIVVDEGSNLVEVREAEAPVEEVPVDAPVEEVPMVDEVIVPEVPVDAPVEEVSGDVKSKTIGELVGDIDGSYMVKVVVVDGEVTEAEVSSETNMNLLKKQVDSLSKEIQKLQTKLDEPIGDPILEAEIVKKDFSKMNAYEKVMYERSLED